MRRILFIAIILFPTGCLGPVAELYPEDEDLRPIPVYILSHGWHVGIAIEAEYINDKIPGHEEIPQTRYLKFGWGDNRYYPHSDPGFGLLLRAALLPTGSVIHVVGFDIPVESYFAGSEVILVKISEAGMEKLTGFIADRFYRDDEGQIEYAADGLYTNSSFFRANGWYFFPKTSNTWTARALRQAGCPISPFYAVTSGNVISQTRSFGEILQERP